MKGRTMNTTVEHWREITPPQWAIDAAVEVQNHISSFVSDAPMAQRAFAAGKIPAREIAQLIAFHVPTGKPKHRVELTPEGWWLAGKAHPCLASLGRQAFFHLFPLAMNAHQNDLKLSQLADEFQISLTEQQVQAFATLAADVCDLMNGEAL